MAKKMLISLFVLSFIIGIQVCTAADDVPAPDDKTEILAAIEKMNQAIQEKNDPMRNKMYFKFRLIEQDKPGIVAPYLIKNLDSTLPGVPEYTAFVLGWIDDNRAVSHLQKMLKDTDSKKIAASRALGFMRATDALEDIVKLLADENPRVRGDAAYSLGLMGDDRANAALKKATSDKDELVRYFAEEALKRIEDYKKFGW